MATSEAIQQLKTDEGFSKFAENIKLSDGTVEAWKTVGHGYNLSNPTAEEDLLLAGVHPSDLKALMAGKKEISKEQAEALLEIALNRAERDVDNLLFNYSTLPQPIKDVLSNMSYNLGKNRLAGFKKMLKAVEEENWPEMRKQMMRNSADTGPSKWAKQVGKRATRLAKKVDQVKVTPISAPISKTAIANSVNAKSLYKQQLHASRVQQLVSVSSRSDLVSRLATLMEESQAEKETADQEAAAQKASQEAKPTIQRLEQGLFEDETGKKFFVDSQHRLLELGEDGQPQKVIDPETFDLTKVQAEEPDPIEPEIF